MVDSLGDLPQLGVGSSREAGGILRRGGGGELWRPPPKAAILGHAGEEGADRQGARGPERRVAGPRPLHAQ